MFSMLYSFAEPGKYMLNLFPFEGVSRTKKERVFSSQCVANVYYCNFISTILFRERKYHSDGFKTNQNGTERERAWICRTECDEWLTSLCKRFSYLFQIIRHCDTGMLLINFPLRSFEAVLRTFMIIWVHPKVRDFFNRIFDILWKSMLTSH